MCVYMCVCIYIYIYIHAYMYDNYLEHRRGTADREESDMPVQPTSLRRFPN